MSHRTHHERHAEDPHERQHEEHHLGAYMVPIQVLMKYHTESFFNLIIII